VSSEDIEERVEEVDAVPVLAGDATLDTRRPAGQVVTQAAAVAATSFVAGAAVVAVARGHKGRKLARKRRKDRQRLGKVVASRSFLVDVHVLGRD